MRRSRSSLADGWQQRACQRRACQRRSGLMFALSLLPAVKVPWRRANFHFGARNNGSCAKVPLGGARARPRATLSASCGKHTTSERRRRRFSHRDNLLSCDKRKSRRCRPASRSRPSRQTARAALTPIRLARVASGSLWRAMTSLASRDCIVCCSANDNGDDGGVSGNCNLQTHFARAGNLGARSLLAEKT